MKVITKIELQKNNSQRCSIYVDDEFAFGVDMDSILKYNIQKGNKYTQTEYEHLLNELQYEKAKFMALRYISYCPRTLKQVVEKLQSYEYAESIIDKTISFLKKYEYINDIEYIKNYIPNRIRNKRYGRHRIIYELAQKGISRDIIEPILDSYEDDEYESAMYLYNKKTKGKAVLDYKEQGNIYRYLQGRGYSYDIIKTVIEHNLDKDSSIHDA